MKNRLANAGLEIDREALARTLGYPDGRSVTESVREVCEEQLARLPGMTDSWGGWREIPIEGVRDGLIHLANGSTLKSRRLARIMGRASALRLIVVSLGERVSVEVRRLMDEAHMIDAMALDAAATVATGQLMRRLVAQVCEGALASGFGTTIRYGPGYTGWEIDDLEVLFQDLAGQEIPVSLTRQLSMRPDKSLVNVVGLVPGGRAAAEIVPCRICDLERCSARREPYRGQPAR